MPAPRPDLWLAAGHRTPFARVGGALARYDALQLSVPVVKAMTATLPGQGPDLAIWGAVAPNLTWSNLAREVMLEAGADPTVPAFTEVMACSTSMIAALSAAAMLDDQTRCLALVGGAESMSRIQIGLTPTLSDRLRAVMEARTLGQRLSALAAIRPSELKLYVPQIKNRATGKSMGEHTEEMAKTWAIPRAAQDELALASHQRAAAAWASGFLKELVLPMEGMTIDSTIRPDTTLERMAKLPPVYDRSAAGTLTAGNSSPLTDGAAGIWVATAKGLDRLPAAARRARLIDWEVGAVDLWHEGLLMWPAYGIPRMLARHQLTYEDVGLWEIHEAFAAQVLCHIKALQDETFLRERVKIEPNFGAFPVERMNPNGGSVALGHPFGATGARILSQAVQELSTRPSGTYAVVSICADGGLGTVALLRSE